MPTTTKQRFQAFQELAKANAAKRQPISPKAFELNKGPSTTSELPEGGELVRYRNTPCTATAAVANMVFGDETAGKVFPGSLLWADGLSRDARLEPLFPMKRAKPFQMSVSNAIMKAGKPSNYACDGTYASYTDALSKIVQNIAQAQARLDVSRSEISDASAALLEVGLSAKGWGASLAASLKSNREKKRASLLISIAQSYFSLTCEPPANQQHFEEGMFTDEQDSKFLIAESTTKGEIGVVRRVTYGRRLLISITTSSSVEEFNLAVKAGYTGVAGSFSGSLTADQVKTLNQAEARLVVIGGKTDAALADNITMPAADLLQKVSTYLGQTVNMDDATSAAIVGFEVEYAYDRQPVIKVDTTNFSEQIREASRLNGGPRKLEAVPFGADQSNVERIKKGGDQEIHTDDNTWTQVEYNLVPSDDRTGVVLKITYDAREGNKDKSFGDTWFRLNMSEEIWNAKNEGELRTIKSITGATNAMKEYWHTGECHGPQNFPAFGALKNVKVAFDAKGREDLKRMTITGAVTCQLEMNPQEEA